MTRDESILDAAAGIVRTGGIPAVNRIAIAEAAGIAASSVSNYGRVSIAQDTSSTTGVVDRIVRDVMAAAVERGDLVVLRAGLAANHPIALDAPRDLRLAALADL